MQGQVEHSAAPGYLRCDFSEEPLGLGSSCPQFSWQCQDKRAAEIESAWQLLVASSQEGLQQAVLGQAEADLWDSGVVPGSTAGFAIPYDGQPLVSRQRAWWTVRSFDSDGLTCGFAEPASFEMGLLSRADWRANWLIAPWSGSATESAGAVALLRDFALAVNPVRARLYAVVLGAARLELNGRLVADGLGADACAHPRLRLRSYSFDVTEHLLAGENRLGVLLGPGWYAGNRLQGAHREAFGQRPRVLLQLECYDEDGVCQQLLSNHRWGVWQSPLLASDPLTGDALDLRRWNPNWCLPGVSLDWPSGRLLTQALDQWHPQACIGTALPGDRRYPPGLREEPVPAEALTYTLAETGEQLPHGSPVPVRAMHLTLPVPHRGRLQLRARAKDQGRVLIRYGMDGMAALAAPDSDRFTAAAASDSFTALLAERVFCDAQIEGDLDWSRPVEVSVQRAERRPGRVESVRFETGRGTLNGVLKALVATCDAFLLPRPTQVRRTAKGQILPALSWTEQIEGSELLLALMGDPPALRQWLEDALDAFRDRGYLPAVLPAAERDGVYAAEGRSDLFVSLLRILYQGCGDRQALMAALPELDLMVARWQGQTRQRYWHDPTVTDADLPAEFIGNLRLIPALELAARLQESLDHLRPAERYRRFSAHLRQGFRHRFLTREGRLTLRDAQACTLALAAGVLEPKEAATAVADLVEALGAAPPPQLAHELRPMLLRVLHEHGEHTIAQQQLWQWLQHWADHREPWAAGPLLTAVLESCAGFTWELPERVFRSGWRDLALTPRFGERGLAAIAGEGLSVFSVAARLACGTVRWSWSRDEQGAITLTAQLPTDVNLSLLLGGQQDVHLVAGQHQLQLPGAGEDKDGIPTLRHSLEGSTRRATR